MLTKKKLPYFFARNITNKIVFLTTEDVYHITKVLRLGCNDKLMIVNKQKHYEAIIMNEEINKLVIKITKLVKQKEQLPFFTIVIGLFKLNHFEWAIQKATELGVDKIIPLLMERSSNKWDVTTASSKTSRWNKIISAASRQAERFDIPVITPVVVDWKQIATIEKSQNKFVCHPSVTKNFAWQNTFDVNQSVVAVVGCEGGFSETELAHLQAFGYKLMTLSNYVLRAETAVTAACALINYERLKTNRKVSNIVT